jgi:hypothetical protein
MLSKKPLMSKSAHPRVMYAVVLTLTTMDASDASHYIPMSYGTVRRYRFGDSQYPHFITFAVVNWIDALSRPLYKDIVVDRLKYCQQEKGLIING